jgi:hypothetical protein
VGCNPTSGKRPRQATYSEGRAPQSRSTTVAGKVSAYRLYMQDAAQIHRRKRRSNRAVLAGLCVMTLALLISYWGIAPPLATTVVAMAGFVLLMYGVHVGWLLFYDREPDGPSS